MLIMPMEKKKFDLVAGVVLLVASVVFLTIPVLLNLDGFIPFMFSLASFIIGIGFFFMGHGEK